MKALDYLKKVNPEFEAIIAHASKSEKRRLRKLFWSQPKEERDRRRAERDFFPCEVIERIGSLEYRFEDGSVIEVAPNTAGMVIVQREGLYVANIVAVRSVEYTTVPHQAGEKSPESGLVGVHRLSAVQKDLEQRLGKKLARGGVYNEGLSMVIFGGYDVPDHKLLGKDLTALAKEGSWEVVPKPKGSKGRFPLCGEVFVVAPRQDYLISPMKIIHELYFLPKYEKPFTVN